jgi:hypothetical protein
MAHVFSHSASKAAEILGHSRHHDDIDRELEKPREVRPSRFISRFNSSYLRSDSQTNTLTLSQQSVSGRASSTGLYQQTYSGPSEPSVVRKQDLRLLPTYTLLFFFYNLNRDNVKYAAYIPRPLTGDAGLLSDLELSWDELRIARTAFCIAAILVSPASNIALRWLGPPRWIALLMFGWGVVGMLRGTLTATSPASALGGVEFLMGVFQAGFLPGFVFHLTFWYKPKELCLRVAAVLAAAVFLGSFGAAMAESIAQRQLMGSVPAWKWIFLVEGLPAALVALAVPFLLPAYPETVNWLGEEEKDIAARRMYTESSHAADPAVTFDAAADTVVNWRLWAHHLVYFGAACAFASLDALVAPTIAACGYAGTTAALMRVPLFVIAAAAALVTAWAAGRHDARAMHAAALAAAAAVGFLASAALPAAGGAAAGRYVALVLATAGSFAALPLLLGWVAANAPDAPSVGFAVALTTGLGGGVGEIVAIWSYRPDEAPRLFPTGNAVNAALLFLVAAGCLLLRAEYVRRNRYVEEAVGRRDDGRSRILRFYSY